MRYYTIHYIANRCGTMHRLAGCDCLSAAEASPAIALICLPHRDWARPGPLPGRRALNGASETALCCRDIDICVPRDSISASPHVLAQCI
ncbi:hypothetical protein IF2G_07398 [Cordyceps javanica]|nr:hypothetical protein IF2G_07398 [Cordyceps javanica]